MGSFKIENYTKGMDIIHSRFGKDGSPKLLDDTEILNLILNLKTNVLFDIKYYKNDPTFAIKEMNLGIELLKNCTSGMLSDDYKTHLIMSFRELRDNIIEMHPNKFDIINDQFSGK